MWPTRATRAELISSALERYSKTRRRLAGIERNTARAALSMQIIASLRRLEYTSLLLARDIHRDRADPFSSLFDPERAAIFHLRTGNIDEACWLIFLATHFGKHSRHGWRRLRDVYSGLGCGIWTWNRVKGDVQGFRTWLTDHQSRIGGAFGNHRKYESLNATSSNGTGAVVASYVNWIGPGGSHGMKIGELVRAGGNDPHRIFDAFYRDMRVTRFGRLGKFDFLAMLGRMDIAPITPGSAYLSGATGPLRGVRLLFHGDPNKSADVSELQAWLTDLDSVLEVGMQVLEDSLCNWQKSPNRFIHFRG